MGSLAALTTSSLMAFNAAMAAQPRPFDERYIPEPTSGCWLWEEAVTRKGYGRIKHRRRDYEAHRFSWMIHRGEIPPGMCVLHKCDTRSCVNPDHLFLGTFADNHADMVRKGRGRSLSGTNNFRAKLTEGDVRAIRSDARPRRTLAKVYGITSSHVGYIQRRDTWHHVP